MLTAIENGTIADPRALGAYVYGGGRRCKGAFREPESIKGLGPGLRGLGKLKQAKHGES
jgi:hypothetical protein